MEKTKTRCKCCQSKRADYINEMLRDNVPLKIISERMLEVYKEQISPDAIARHRANHLPQPHSNNDRVREVEKEQNRGEDETHSDKVTEVDVEEEVAEDPLSKMEARLNVLEIILAEQASTSQYTAFYSYNMAGETPNVISYQDLILERMPDKKDIHAQYKAIAASVKQRIVKEQGLVLSDESFIKPRAELLAKDKKHVNEQLEAAIRDLEEKERERVNFRNQMDQVVAREKLAKQQTGVPGVR